MTSNIRVSRSRDGRRTVDKLLDAALYLFEAGATLSDCTVERISAEAHVSKGKIYRRYGSNDAFLSAIFLRYLDQALAAGPEELFATLFRSSLEDTAERVVSTLLRPYRSNPGMHRAIEHFLRSRPDSAFALNAPERIAEYMRNIAAVLVPHRAMIAHADPERAAMIAVLNAASAIEDSFLDYGPEWDKALPRATQLLVSERTRALIAYLRAMPVPGPPVVPAPLDYDA
ncbi:MAG: TetR family transcriptional regulator [Acidobacteriota bacterium]